MFWRLCTVSRRFPVGKTLRLLVQLETLSVDEVTSEEFLFEFWDLWTNIAILILPFVLRCFVSPFRDVLGLPSGLEGALLLDLGEGRTSSVLSVIVLFRFDPSFLTSRVGCGRVPVIMVDRDVFERRAHVSHEGVHGRGWARVDEALGGCEVSCDGGRVEEWCRGGAKWESVLCEREEMKMTVGKREVKGRGKGRR